MLPIHTAPVSVASETASRGQILARRNQTSPWVGFLESGRVVLGVMAGDVMEHQLGVLEGPCWLEAFWAVLDLLPAVDAVADTDVARAHRQQTELAVSRLAKDAEARCAEWLLQHAAPFARAQPDQRLGAQPEPVGPDRPALTGRRLAQSTPLRLLPAPADSQRRHPAPAPPHHAAPQTH